MTDACRWWVGIDVGKQFHWMVILDDDGASVTSRKVINDEAAIAEAISEVRALGGDASWTVDLTTTYAALLVTMLATAGQPVRYLAGRAVWQASSTYRGGEAKTDAKDARVIADQGRMRGTDLPLLRPSDELVTELAMLTTHREDLVADHTRTINRLRQQLGAISPALERISDPRNNRGWILLFNRYHRPKAIRRSGVARLTRFLEEAGSRTAAKIAAAAVVAAKAQTVALPGEAIAAGLVAELVQSVIDLDARIKATDTAIEERFRRHRLAEAIVSMSGIGFRLGSGVPLRCRRPRPDHLGRSARCLGGARPGAQGFR